MKDILRATKDGDTAESHALLSSLALPDPQAWFREVFGSDASSMVKHYPTSQPRLEQELAALFLRALNDNYTDVTTYKHEKSCDDNSGEEIYPVLFMRRAPVPLYEVRFHHGTMFYRLWALAYAEGGFRFVGNLQVPQIFPPTKIGAGTLVEQMQKRIAVGGAVMSKKLVKQVYPSYPGAAKDERLQGTVRLHALVAPDGAVRQLRVVSGYCSLAEASVEAVRKWRYSPTLLNGEPVEVESFIEVIFQLRP